MAERRWPNISRGALVSIALHALVAAVLLVSLPLPEFTPPAEESVNVELVPPPEESAPEKPIPEEKPKAEEKPPEPTPEESPPEPQDEQAAAPPDDRVPIPILRPVLEFGEKDTGPAPSDRSDPGRSKAAPAETKAAQKQAEAPAAAAPLDLKLPEDDASEVEAAAPAEPAPTLGAETAKPDDASKAEATDEAGQPEAQEPLTEAKRLFSEAATDDPTAQTAMGDLPRDLRVEQLCSTELYAQLRHGSPPYEPQLLPSYRLSKGTVLEVRRAAFYAKNRWFDLSFRCEVDTDATRVLAFAFAVGSEVPKRDWKKRGFPPL